jgi:iron(III) transport system permease protein
MTDQPLAPLFAAPARRRGAFDWLTWAAPALAALLAIPALSVAFHLFLPSQGAGAHLAATVLGTYVFNTLVLTVAVAAGVGFGGVATAWLVTMCKFPGRRHFEWALVLPLAMPAYVIAYAYTDLLQFTGPVQSALRAATGWGAGDYWFPPVRSLGGAAVMFVMVLYPYVYLLARSAFLEQSVCVLDVSRTLGCGPWASFFRVALPLARPSIAAGVALALMEVLNDFGTVDYFAVPTFTTGIYRAWFTLGDRVGAAQLAAGLLAFAFALLLLERQSRALARHHHTSSRYQALPSYQLRGWRAAAAMFICAVPVVLGFLLPAALLANRAWTESEGGLGGRYLALAGNSFMVAALAASAALALALVMAYGARLRPGPATFAANRVAGLGYAVPGSIIAVGALIPLSWLDNIFADWMRANFGLAVGLVVTGSVAALVYAYCVRFLAIALQTVEASLGKITPSMDDAARTLGVGPGATLRRVHMPIMAGSLMTAWLIVLVDVMKELPATILMRPFNFDTLAVQVYNLAKDERLAEAALPALTIVGVGLVPVIVLTFAIARARPGHGVALEIN